MALLNTKMKTNTTMKTVWVLVLQGTDVAFDMETPVHVVTTFFEAVNLFAELSTKHGLTDSGYAFEENWMAANEDCSKVLRCFEKKMLSDVPMTVEIINDPAPDASGFDVEEWKSIESTLDTLINCTLARQDPAVGKLPLLTSLGELQKAWQKTSQELSRQIGSHEAFTRWLEQNS